MEIRRKAGKPRAPGWRRNQKSNKDLGSTVKGGGSWGQLCWGPDYFSPTTPKPLPIYSSQAVLGSETTVEQTGTFPGRWTDTQGFGPTWPQPVQ